MAIISAVLAVLGCQTTNYLRENFDNWHPVSSQHITFKIDFPPGSIEFRQGTQTATQSTSERFSWSATGSFLQGTHVGAGPGTYIRFNSSDTDQINEKLNWVGKFGDATGGAFNAAPDPRTVRQLDGHKVWIADLPQPAGITSICMSGLFVASRGTQEPGQGAKGAITDEVRVLSCGSKKNEAAFRQQFEQIMLSIAV